MKDTPEMEWFKNSFRQYVDIKDVSDWRVLNDAAIFRKHAGDLDGAIEAMVKSISLTRTMPNLAEKTALSLNYLAAELYLKQNATEQAEAAIREAVELSRSLNPSLLGDNLLVLAAVLSQQGDYGEARASAEEARQLFQEQGHSYGVAQAEELIGRIAPSKEKGDAAI